jgi:hypothetical protein
MGGQPIGSGSRGARTFPFYPICEIRLLYIAILWA